MPKTLKMVAAVSVVLVIGGCSAAPSPDAAYLASVENTWEGAAQPTDAEYVAAGHAACEQMGNGIARDAVKVIDSLNYDSEVNNILIVRLAIRAYCPEYA